MAVLPSPSSSIQSAPSQDSSSLHRPAELAVQRSFFSRNWEIIALYFFLLAGSLWHVLGVLQTAMKVLAAPVVVMLALWMIFRYDQALRRHKSGQMHPSATARFHYWSLGVVFICFGVEYAGVKTGLIFGRYQYMDAWIPAVNGVPLAIGFAWLGMLLGSFALVQRYTSAERHSLWVRALMLALCMTVFDIFMEPVAVKLHYWHWLEETSSRFFVAPVQNYAAWFIISYCLGVIALRVKIFQHALPPLVWHSFWAQLLYFAIIAAFAPS